MAAYDNISLGNAPSAASYAGPLVNFGALSELPAAYQQGNQDARTRALQGAFREGLPRDAQGNLDIGKMSETLARLGGADAAMPLINLGIQQQQNTNLANAIRNGAPSATDNQPNTQPRTPVYVPPTGIPAADSGTDTQRGQDQNGPITPQRLAKVQSQEPSNSGYRPETEHVTGTPGAAEGGKNTLMGIVTDAYGPDQAGVVAPRVQAAHGIADANAPLDPDTMARVQRSIAAQKVAQGQAQPTNGSSSSIAQMTDPNATALSRADQADREGRNLLAAAAGSLNLPAGQKDALEKAAQSRFDFAKQLRESVYKNQAPTDAQKQYQADRQPGESQAAYEARVAGGKKTAEEQGSAFVKKYDKAVEEGGKAVREIPQLSFIQNQMKDPNFYSGFGSKYVQIWNQLKSAAGYDPGAAFSQEAFGKVVSGNLLNSLSGLQGLGQIRVAEINIAKEANASQNFTPQTNEFLVEMSKRVHERSADLAAIATHYNNGSGVLNAGYDRLVQMYDKGTLPQKYVDQWGLSSRGGPILSQQEIDHWREIRQQPQRTPSAGSTANATGQTQQNTAPAEVTAVHPDGRVLVLRNGQWVPQQGAGPQPVPLR